MEDVVEGVLKDVCWRVCENAVDHFGAVQVHW